MDETLKTVIFDYEKSTYRIELIKSENSKIFVAIEQTVYAYFSPKKYVVRIRQSALENFIQALTEMREETPTHIPERKSRIKDKDKKEIIRRYLNTGLEIETLAVQFNCTVGDIRQFLTYSGIAITSNKFSEARFLRKFGRRRKKKGGK